MRLVDNIFNSMLGAKSAPAISAAVQDLDNTAENYNPEVMAWLNSTSWYKGNPNYITFEEAAAVDSKQFSETNNAQKKAIVTFDEARFFTSVTYLAPDAFYGCELLERITIPDSVTSIGNEVFRSCSSLALTSLPSGLTSIGISTFNGCTSLALTSLPSGLTSIGIYAFSGCTSLALTSLPSGLTSIGIYAFSGCLALKDTLYEIPSSVTEIGDRAFRYVKFSALKFLGLTPPTFGTQSIYALPQKVDCQVPGASLAEYKEAMKVLTDEGLVIISTY